MADLQATVELALQIHKFYNVDLFQRGYYQIRVCHRSSSKLPVSVEISLPRTTSDWKSGNGLVFPSCVVNGSVVSKTFQILYRNEEVSLDDSANLKLHFIVDCNKMEDNLERTELQLVVELWFTESTFAPDHHNAIQCISARTLQLNFSPLRGLHYHLPVLFDYFHLSAVTLSINCVLLSLHQPYINSGKSSKSKYSPKINSRPNMEGVFFTNVSTVKCAGGGGTSSWRLNQARKMHRTICNLLLSAHTALASQLDVFLSILPVSSGTPEGAGSTQSASVSSSQPIRLKTDNLSEAAKECYYSVIGGQNSTVQGNKKTKERGRSLDSEEEFILTANSDVAHLCAENILLWQQFLLVINLSEPIRQYLARLHHLQRVKRFSEAFFVIDNPRPSATGCYDSNYQNYAVISEGVRRSRYLNLLPSLPVSCLELDGDWSTIPVIFEDQYQHVAEFARRRSIAKRKSENFLNGNDIDSAFDQLESADRNEDLSNPPDVTKPTNGVKIPKEVKTSKVLRLSKSKPNLYSSKLPNEQNLKSFNLGIDQKYNKYGTHPVKSQPQTKTGLISTKSEKNLKSIPSYKSKEKSRPRNAYGRSRSTDSRPFIAAGGVFIRTESGSDSEEFTGSQKASRSLRISRLSKEKGDKHSNSEETPPLPPRTDKMPKDFKPPIPPKTHKLPEARSTLKEKLKNNLKLELKLPSSQGGAYKKTKFKVRLIQRAQQLKSSATLRHKKKTKKSDAVTLLKYKTLEPSLSMPYNLCANTPGGDSLGEHAMKHSQSTLSMPSFLWDIAGSTSPVLTESFPDLLASETESSSEVEIKKPAISPRTKMDRSSLTLSNVEVGLVSSADHALLQIGNLPGRLQPIPKYKENIPFARSLQVKPNMSIPESSSNSDITSEQSGWVSTSSRQSSSSSSCQISPKLSIRKFPVKDILASSTTLPVDIKERDIPSYSIDYFSLQPRKVKKSAFKFNSGSLYDYKSYPSRRGKHKISEVNLRSSSNDHLLSEMKPDSTEFKKSHSLQRVGNTQKPTIFMYEPVSLPPPPKEFRDPKPGSTKIPGFATTGRTHREVKANRQIGDLSKERPRSESPRNDGINEITREVGHIKHATMQKKQLNTTEMNGSCDTVVDVISDMKNSVQRTAKSGSKRDKFSSLPSMRKFNSLVATNEYIEKNKTKQSNGILTMRTVDAKYSNELLTNPIVENGAADNFKPKKGKEISPLKYSKRHESSSQVQANSSYRKSVDALSYLADNKLSLLELFLEQQGTSVWAQREGETVNKDNKRPAGVQKSREKSKSQPHLNDVNDCMSTVPISTRPPSSRSGGKCTCPSENQKERIRSDEPPPDVLPQKLSPPVPDTVEFVKAREEFRQQINFQGLLYSDFANLASSIPYFDVSDDNRTLSPDGLHLIVCVHGLDGNSADLRLVKTHLEMGLPGANLDFLMSERNQGDTFSNFETLIDRLVSEILYHIDAYNINPRKISFVGHSLGNIIIRGAVSHKHMKPLLSKLHTFLSLSGPHLGTLYNNSGLVNMGMWFMQKWKRSGSLLQLALKDKEDIRQTFLYKLSQKSQLHTFKNVVLCGSSQDRYVPLHSARIELCRQAVKDNSILGAAYREMVSNLLQPLISSSAITLVRFDIHHALPSTANSLIGRAAHIAVLDSDLFIEKFLLVTGMKYFK